MLLVALRGVMARKLRLALTSIAIVLGVGFVAGAFFLTDSMRASFDTLFTEAVAGIDVEVTTEAYRELAKEAASSAPGTVPIDVSQVGVPPDALERIQQVDGVELAAGTVFEMGAQPLDASGDLLGGNGAPSFAAGWVEGAEEVSALRILDGEAPSSPDEIMLDEATFDASGYELGDSVRVLIHGGRKVEEFTLSGVVGFGSSATLNGATITVFQTPTVQELLGLGDRFTAVDVVAEEGVSAATLKARIQRELGSEYHVITGTEFVQEQTDAMDTAFLDILQNVILGFAAVAVFVGAFTIFNTFTILVGQRTREFGLLRCVGAGRAQIIGIVALEALLLGVFASTIGIVVGYGIAGLLREVLSSFGGELPAADFSLRARTLAWAYGVGIVVTLVASVVPAWRASRLSPLDALRVTSATGARGWRGPAVGLVLTLIGALLVLSGFFADDDTSTQVVLSSIGGGFAVAIIGLALLSRLFIAPVTRVLGVVFARGTAGRLALGNVNRNRSRAATTAAALMIGLALASLVLVFHASLGRTVDAQLDELVGADIAVYNGAANSGSPAVVSEEIVDAIRDVDGVGEVAGQRYGGLQVGDEFAPAKGDILTVAAFDDAALGEDGLVNLTIDEGEALPGDDVLVETQHATDNGYAVGDEIEFAFASGESRSFEIVGLFEGNQITGAPFILSTESYDELQPEQLRAPGFVYVEVEEGARPATVVGRIKKALGEDGSYIEVQDTAGLREQFSDQLAPVLGIVLGMLSLSLIIALFGIGNTLALNVFERTREIGLLRAVGGTRPQLRRIIRVEAVLVALFGAIVGVLVGIGAGAALIAALRDEGFVFAINPVAMVLVLAAGLLAGLLASILPARRAARMDVLEAIATE